jgi:nucleotide-binding universal stress UspA family protein
MFKKIYVPVDNSEYSNQAIEMALALAKPWNATIIGSHVYAAKRKRRRMQALLPRSAGLLCPPKNLVETAVVIPLTAEEGGEPQCEQSTRSWSA